VDQEDECTADCPSALVRRVCDTYVVLPASTLFCDLIRAALAQLSFPTSDVLSASGMVNLQCIMGNIAACGCTAVCFMFVSNLKEKSIKLCHW
jgi:hypothetical protein